MATKNKRRMTPQIPICATISSRLAAPSAIHNQLLATFGKVYPMSSTPLKRTLLYDTHVALGARMVPFAGFEMPVQYASPLDEHQTVRAAAGLFDIDHMGQIIVEGPDAA